MSASLLGVTGHTAASARVPAPEHGSATPEEAARFFADGFVAGDADEAMSAFALDSMVSTYSFAADIERTRAVTALTPLPADGYAVLDEALHRQEIGFALGELTRSALLPEMESGDTFSLIGAPGPKALKAQQFEARLDPAGLRRLSVARVDVIDAPPGTGLGDALLAGAAPYGADGVRTVAVLFTTTDGPAALAVTTIQFGDQWYVWSLSSPILPTDLAQLTPMSEEAYGAMVEQARQLPGTH